jgi:tRNA U34 5-methylaminomethyl-2-thiouridine-forming methyltransferase MnmC
MENSMLKDLKTQHKNKTRDIFLLANNYHSIAGSDIQTDDLEILLEKVNSEWEKINEKLIKNGHKSIEIASIISLDEAHDVAYLVLNSVDKIKKRYN